MTRIKIILSSTLLLLAAKGYGQMTLRQVFQDLHSTDAKVRDTASRAIVQVFQESIPTINAEAATLCPALIDSDWYIRMQASGILSTLVQFYPANVALVTACTPQLIKSGMDTDDQVRINSLNALAHKADGPPADAAPVFEAGLIDPNLTVKMHAASGIMRLPPRSNSSSQTLLAERISVEQDPQSEEALLVGAASSGKTSNEVSQSALRQIANPDPRVQVAAIAVTETVSTDKKQALSQLQNYQSSGHLSPEAKQMIGSSISRLQGTPVQPQ